MPAVGLRRELGQLDEARADAELVPLNAPVLDTSFEEPAVVDRVQV